MKREYFKKTILVMTIVLSVSTFSYAHSGRTDSSGGHRDNKNKSGLGSYHYHCGGNPAHLHGSGYCPYGSGSSNRSNSDSSSSEYLISQKKSKINKEGYNNGYNDGYSNAMKGKYSYSGEYPSEYESGYEKGYSEGENKLRIEMYNADEKGYSLGLTGESFFSKYKNNAVENAYKVGYDRGYSEYLEKTIAEYRVKGYNDGYSNKEKSIFNEQVLDKFKDAYESSYSSGYSKYIDETIELYKQKGIEDSKLNLPMKNFEEEDILDIFKKAYKSEYNKIQQELKKEYSEIGFATALKGLSLNSVKEDNEKYRNWINEGYELGKGKLEKAIAQAYTSGYNKEELSIDKSLELAKEKIIKSFNEGLMKKELEEKEEKEKISMGIGIACVSGVGGLIYYKKQVGNNNKK